MMRRTSVCVLITALVLTAAGGQWLLARARASDRHTARLTSATRPSELDAVRSGTPPPTVPPHREPGYQPTVETGITDHQGNTVGVACATCHMTRPPDRANGLEGKRPTAFHQGLHHAHGNQSCLSCHHADDYDALRLADGRKLAFADAQNLCAQCHGPQTRDYLHGSHGGMRGYWDRSKGERTRNTCTDCHDPHAPAYPALKPVFAPRDAGARQQAEREKRNQHDSSADERLH